MIKICEICGKPVECKTNRTKYHKECAKIAKKEQMKAISKRCKPKCDPSIQNCLNCERSSCNGSSSNVTMEESAAVHNVLDGKSSDFSLVKDLKYKRSERII